MAPPEVVLDRWIKSQAQQRHEFAGYVGKLDLERAFPAFKELLRFVQDTMNMALRLENTNASGGAAHPPFHFDYVEVSDGTKNAHAFQHDGYSFIVATRPLIELLWDISAKLSGSPIVRQFLGIGDAAVRTEAIHALIFQLQLTFLVSHEYTHHVHRHCESSMAGSTGVWTEFHMDEFAGRIDDQVLELDADAYGLYLVLANFIRGGGREGALAQLGQQHLSKIDADSLLLTCFFIAVLAFFCAIWPEDIKMDSVWQLSHPPPPVRIDFTIRVAQLWCSQNESLPESWFTSDRLQEIFQAVLAGIRGAGLYGWDAHISFFRGEEGTRYNRKLLEMFEASRKGTQTSV